MMHTDPLQLRKNVDKQKMNLDCSSIYDLQEIWDIIKDVLFSIQIIQNHKITNFKEAFKYYSILENAESDSEVFEQERLVYNQLKSLTDGMIKKEILEKANNKK